MLWIALALFLLGCCCGSFVNALIYRIHEQAKKQPRKSKASSKQLSILNGRSICPKCKHQLAWYDLIPVLSWLMLMGKCRYCRKPIADNPLVELILGLVFAASYIFWPQPLQADGQILLITSWLLSAVGLMALAVYDLRWMLLPNRIVYPTLLASVIGRAGYIAIFSQKPLKDAVLWIASIAIASGVFFVLHVVSKGKWIGFGDVRLGLITGTLLAEPQKSLAMLFLASVIGTAVILPGLLKGQKNLASRLPYGPFLIIATAILVIFGDSLLNWYKGLIL